MTLRPHTTHFYTEGATQPDPKRILVVFRVDSNAASAGGSNLGDVTLTASSGLEVVCTDPYFADGGFNAATAFESECSASVVVVDSGEAFSSVAVEAWIRPINATAIESFRLKARASWASPMETTLHVFNWKEATPSVASNVTQPTYNGDITKRYVSVVGRTAALDNSTLKGAVLADGGVADVPMKGIDPTLVGSKIFTSIPATVMDDSKTSYAVTFDIGGDSEDFALDGGVVEERSKIIAFEKTDGSKVAFQLKNIALDNFADDTDGVDLVVQRIASDGGVTEETVNLASFISVEGDHRIHMEVANGKVKSIHAGESVYGLQATEKVTLVSDDMTGFSGFSFSSANGSTIGMKEIEVKLAPMGSMSPLGSMAVVRPGQSLAQSRSGYDHGTVASDVAAACAVDDWSCLAGQDTGYWAEDSGDDYVGAGIQEVAEDCIEQLGRKFLGMNDGVVVNTTDLNAARACGNLDAAFTSLDMLFRANEPGAASIRHNSREVATRNVKHILDNAMFVARYIDQNQLMCGEVGDVGCGMASDSLLRSTGEWLTTTLVQGILTDPAHLDAETAGALSEFANYTATTTTNQIRKSYLQQYEQCIPGEGVASLNRNALDAASLAVQVLETSRYMKDSADTDFGDFWTVAELDSFHEDAEQSILTLNNLRLRQKNCPEPFVQDGDVPLFFGDVQGDNSRYFASSDYLSERWARPAVAEASSSLEVARNTWVQRRSASIGDQDYVASRQRTIDGLRDGLGATVTQYCGNSYQEYNFSDLVSNDDDWDALVTDTELPTSGLSFQGCGWSTEGQCRENRMSLDRQVFSELSDELMGGEWDPDVMTTLGEMRTPAIATVLKARGVPWKLKFNVPLLGDRYHEDGIPGDLAVQVFIRLATVGNFILDVRQKMTSLVTTAAGGAEDFINQLVDHMTAGIPIEVPDIDVAGPVGGIVQSIETHTVAGIAGILNETPMEDMVQIALCLSIADYQDDVADSDFNYGLVAGLDTFFDQTDQAYIEQYCAWAPKLIGTQGNPPSGRIPLGSLSESEGTLADTVDFAFQGQSEAINLVGCDFSDCVDDTSDVFELAVGSGGGCVQTSTNGDYTEQYEAPRSCDEFSTSSYSRELMRLFGLNDTSIIQVSFDNKQAVQEAMTFATMALANDYPLSAAPRDYQAVGDAQKVVHDCALGEIGVLDARVYDSVADTRNKERAVLNAMNAIEQGIAQCQVGTELQEHHQLLADLSAAGAHSLDMITSDFVGFSSFMTGVIGGVAKVANAIVDVGGAIDRVAEAKAQYERHLVSTEIEYAKYGFKNAFNSKTRELENAGAQAECTNRLRSSFASYEAALDALVLARRAAVNASIARGNAHRTMALQVRNQVRALGREMRFQSIPRLHHLWIEEKLEKAERNFSWAQRLTYLTARATEYEFQQSMGVTRDILRATNPSELEEALREIDQIRASRTINRARPQEATSVLSLRDDILVDTHLRNAGFTSELDFRDNRTKHLQQMLTDPAYAVHNSDNEYLGQGIPFRLEPKGELLHRCGERLWTMTASLQGNRLQIDSPTVPLYILKQNTFQSQWCEGHGGGEEFQVGAISPSSELFRDADDALIEDDQSGYSWSLLQPYVNTPRTEFYREGYAEGATEELAGRGLYGEYILLFPWHGLLDEDFAIQNVEDVLLRFDYISVANGPDLLD